MAPPHGGYAFLNIIMNFRNLQEGHLRTIHAKYHSNLASVFRDEYFFGTAPWRQCFFLKIMMISWKTRPQWCCASFPISWIWMIFWEIHFVCTWPWLRYTLFSESLLFQIFTEWNWVLDLLVFSEQPQTLNHSTITYWCTSQSDKISRK